MNGRISLDHLSENERIARAEAAFEGMRASLEAKFPTAQGYRHAVKIRVAAWAWPSGSKQSEAQILASLAPDVRARAFRRRIRVTKGATWGLTVDVQTTDAQTNGLHVSALSESPLAVFAGAGGVVVGVAAALAVYFATKKQDDDPRNFGIAVVLGMVVGLVLAAIAWVATRPLEGLKPDALSTVLAEISSNLTAAVANSAT